MDYSKLYLVDELEGYTPHIARLVSMMNYIRFTTKQAVEGLTLEELDHCMDDQSNSIGALLQHIAAVDFIYYLYSFEGRDATEEERTEWFTALRLGEKGHRELKGKTLEELLEMLDDRRGKTLEALKEKDDEWLHKVEKLENGSEWNNYWKWFHVMEDEANHRGQIRILRKRLPKRESEK